MEDLMPDLTRETRFWRETCSTRPNASISAYRLIVALIACIAKRFARTEDGITARYSGCGWGDETERRLVGDVLDRRRGGFFS
jgi:hypothetical protein